MKRNRLFLQLFLMVHSLVGAQEGFTSLGFSVPYVNDAITIAGKTMASYELKLTNYSQFPVQLKSMAIVHSNSGNTIFSFGDEELNTIKSKIGFNDGQSIIDSGNTGVLYLDYPIPSSPVLELSHKIAFTIEGQSYTVTGAEISIVKNTQVLGPPLKGGPWAAVYSNSWPKGHRRVIYTVGGVARIPGRFAIDFFKLDHKGKPARGNMDVVTNWFGFGADVLAVADGMVVSIGTGFIDSGNLKSHPKYKAGEATGNYLSIDIGDGNFAFYEHLKANNIYVKQGQKVKKGDVIASLGFTGSSTGPHLHFHVANQDSPLGAEGVPFVFDRFVKLGSYRDFGNFGKEVWDPLQKPMDSLSVNERPSSNSVILFME